MRKPSKMAAAVLVSTLVLIAWHSANGQGLKQEIVKGIVTSLGPDAIQAIVTQVVSEIAKKPELRRQLVQALGPEASRAIIALVTEHATGAVLMPAHQAVPRGPVKGSQAQLPHENQATPANPWPGGPQVTQNQPVDAPNSKEINLGPLAIIVNPSNPISQLTVDQVRRLASGEYTNWNQVGGPDRPVKVVTVRGGRAASESLLHTTLAPTKVALAFNSFIIPAVDQNEGAVGLIPTSTLEQVEFIGKHEAIKVIGIKKDDRAAPAVAPSRMTVFTRSYPMM